MMDTKRELHLLLEDPLFANIKLPTPPPTADDRLVEKMQAINEFYAKYNREPSPDGAFEEKRLARSLAALRAENNESIKSLDIYSLL